MSKLTLSVDDRVIVASKAYARSRNTSVSSLVTTLLRLVASPGAEGTKAQSPPVLSALRGSIKRGSVSDYRRYISRKYR